MIDRDDPFDLQRFVDAQQPVYPSVLRELGEGRKRSHWMWFVFPQLRGLGASEMSRRYGIGSREEARGYCEHPVLGPRLHECTQLVLDVPGLAIGQILGHPDDLKFRSCMTLFERCAPQPEIFRAALARYYDGDPDRATLEALARGRRVTLYTRADCALCDAMKLELQRRGYEVAEVDVDRDRELKKRYGWDVPVAVTDDGTVVARHRL